jgi:glycosyltransferase involved in cell wall biosynthesis
MIVALDATPLTLTSGGLRRYAAELSLALAAEYPGDTFYLVSDQPFALPPGAPPNLLAGGGPRSAAGRRWWSWGLDRELTRVGADVFHGTNFEVPLLRRRPSVLALHDLSPWMDARWHGGASRVRRRTPALIRMGIATIVMTGTEAVRREAIARFHLHPSRIVAVPLAAASHFRPAPWTPDKPYFLFTGTLEPRKNIPVVIEAWRAIRRAHPEIELVLAGRRRADVPPVAAEPGLRLLGEVPDEDLPRLYSGALATLYPSLYEGFGLPVIEAMQCGAAVIASRDPALMEVSDGAAHHVDASDGRRWAEALECALRPEWRASSRERSLARAKQFSWAQTARLTREVYAEAAARF